MSKSLTYIEFDVPFCSRTYGVAPCTAALGVTGAIKCFNSKATCQDRANFNGVPTTLRFARATSYLPADIDYIEASVVEISFTPVMISLGEDLGRRATLEVRFRDHPHSDTPKSKFDKYLSERPYDPFRQGTFWGKFAARHPFLQGLPVRWITGVLGDPLAAMETRHFVIESISGPDRDGMFTLIAKDVLKLADKDRAQAPVLSNGFLVADITAVATSATLSPAGIGNLEYPASGHVAIGGKEICSFTRSGDVLTLTRGQLNTVADAHRQQDRVQLCLRYVAQDPADIIRDLLVTYADVPSAHIPLASWKIETAAFLNRLYTATIAEPIAVSELASELIEQACLALWWDDHAQQIKLQVLRGVVTDADTFTADNVIDDSFNVRAQPDKRMSQIWTYFAQIDPLKRLDPDNFRSTARAIDTLAEDDYGVAAIKKIFSRWIPEGGRSVADRLNTIQLSRFRDPPRLFEFAAMRGNGLPPVLAGGYRLEQWMLQDETGAPANVPVQVISLMPSAELFKVKAEEMLFSVSADDLSVRQIILDANINNVNLRSIHDTLFPAPIGGSPGEVVVCTVLAGVLVGSTTTGAPALDVGTWPAGVSVTVIVIGRVQGRGGDGGKANGSGGLPEAGHPGGTALFTRFPITLDAELGAIFGGGGGGAAGGFTNRDGGGGGGAGQLPGLGGLGDLSRDGASGTTEAGGAGGVAESGGGDGGAGGAPGQPGAPGESTTPDPPAAGGAPGAAIDGISFVSFNSPAGDIRGPQVN
jgi:hypothetical protein